MSSEAYPMVLLVLTSVAMTFILVRGSRPLSRKLLRFLGLVFPLAIFPRWGIWAYRICLFIPAVILAFLEAARALGHEDVSILGRLLSPIAREREGRGFFGFSAWFWGAALASLAPGGIGPAVTTMGTLCDPWASMAGSAWGGRRTVLGKTWAGSWACLLASVGTGASFVMLFPWTGVSFLQVVVVSAAMTAAERYSPGEYDNLSIQAAGAAAMLLSAWAFH